jgi:hypothetical protein
MSVLPFRTLSLLNIYENSRAAKYRQSAIVLSTKDYRKRRAWDILNTVSDLRAS